ncbi:MAG: undecaprenyldiphospho-muramoylpentapeptide beta-N-acetylglucosaminyltransferase [Anaerolineae bacterium]|jgi:UDP-N-acetylglucosamine--N-acetylmuramyl-(pentapeptide) pyrophosphoryl-undecaprenol N-acetylglucosamine transferase
MRVLIAGGGTGGHVYPALSVVEALLAEPRFGTGVDDVAWVGSVDSVEERIVTREKIAFYTISAGALRGAGPIQAVRSTAQLGRGIVESRRIISQLRPDVVLATGGYISVPPVLAARSQRVPSLIYLPDMEPGLAVRMLSKVSQRIAVSFDSVTTYFDARKVFVSGYPVRRALHQTDRDAARESLGLSGDAPVVLIFGGSRGARSINEAVRGSLRELLNLARVIHVSGYEDHDRLSAARDELSADERARYHLYAYLHEQMTDAFVAADLVVARSGAATLGEFPAAGVPAVLVPYPYAGQHQRVNAEFMAQRGAAIVLDDADLMQRLLPALRDLLGDRERLAAMRDASRAMAVPQAAENIAQALQDLARGTS